MAQLVTSGDSIKIWETPGYECLHEWFSSTPNSDCRYSWNSWSVDHGCVATAVKGRDKVVLTYSKNDKYSSQEIQLQGITSPSVIKFPRITQKNLFVSSDNTVHMYDLSRQKINKSFKLKSRVSSFVLNNCDAYLAAGCDDGSIQLVTVGTNQTSQPMLAAKCTGQRISALQYSSFKPSLLAASCESGVLSFWDCNTNKNVFSFSPHLAPAKDIAFSPINANLLLSVGLDKKLVCCDPSSRKILMSIQCEYPLTCVDFHHNGATLIVGTSHGKILQYNLRNPKAPEFCFTAHNSSVSSAVFRNNPSVNSSNKSKSKLTQHKSVPSLKTVLEEKENKDPEGMAEEKEEERDEVFSQEVMEARFPPSRRESTSSMIFSPLREPVDSPLSQVNGSLGQVNARESLNASSVIFSPVRDLDTTQDMTEGIKSGAPRMFLNSVFSPLQDSTSPASSSLGLGRKTPLSGLATPVMSPLAVTNNDTREKLALNSLDTMVKKTIPSGDNSPVFQPASPERKTQRGSQSSSLSSTSVSSQTEEVTRSSELRNVLTAFPDLAASSRGPNTRHDISSAVEIITEKLTNSPSLGEGSREPTDVFQRDFVKGVVSEAMQEWCDSIEKRMWGLQYSLLRQMQHHQEETKSMLAEMSGLARLKEDRERLLEENRELRKFFGTNP